MGQTKLIKIVV